MGDGFRWAWLPVGLFLLGLFLVKFLGMQEGALIAFLVVFFVGFVSIRHHLMIISSRRDTEYERIYRRPFQR